MKVANHSDPTIHADPAPPSPALLKKLSGRKISIWRSRLRAMTASAVSLSPDRASSPRGLAATRMPTMRLPGVAPRGPISKKMK